ncbi:hypothetical protein OG898_15290 [Streptomyces sp. NBC_00193]|uniref:hypothetical protein n=1 Tax=unclassified Streptomyces TaxID=2593676 RepID=UPI00225BF0AF|nr:MULTISPECIES: hypothetical protein [unclassified Streptomyces]MCX5124655.1 hypothetical protein [Streptomyces sp. NBC_00347]MCX5297833.1 hypothetical protein [Streptomyces sp. NBC_00193]
MNTTEVSGLTAPLCCAHLISWHDGPRTARTAAFATRAGLPAEASTPKSATAVEPPAGV